MQVWLLIMLNREAGVGQCVLRSRSQDNQYGQHRHVPAKLEVTKQTAFASRILPVGTPTGTDGT